MSIRGIVTTIFGLLTAGFVVAFTENYKELLKKWHGNTLLVRACDKLLAAEWQNALRWERLRGLWWLWCIFGLNGGIALALWLSPLLTEPLPASANSESKPQPATATEIARQQPAVHEQGPITWGALLLQGGGSGSIGGMSFYGDSVSPVEIKDAYVVQPSLRARKGHANSDSFQPSLRARKGHANSDSLCPTSRARNGNSWS
jgi:hypothetical protein